MAKKHDVRQTKGTFEFKGNICNRDNERFAFNHVFDSGSEKNEANIGIQTSIGNQVYAKVEDFVKKEAMFSSYDKATKKNTVKKCDWDDRFDFNEEGFNPFFGLSVKTSHEEELVRLFGYDAVEQLKELKDGQGVVVKGNIKYSSYEKETSDGVEVIKKTDFNPTGIYAQEKPFVFEGEGFDAESFDEKNKFEQEIIFMGIDKDPEIKGRGLVQACVVTYEGVEDLEFIVDQKKLYDLIKKNLKPYTMIKVLGRLYNRLDETQVDDEPTDTWGEDEDMGNTYVPRIREMVITKAYPDSIDKETYTEAIINGIKKVDDDFGGEVKKADDDEEEVWD